MTPSVIVDGWLLLVFVVVDNDDDDSVFAVFDGWLEKRRWRRGGDGDRQG